VQAGQGCGSEPFTTREMEGAGAVGKKILPVAQVFDENDAAIWRE
jgi:hypothetical protein